MTLRGMGIVAPDVLSAIERVPREMFVPPALRDHAYENASLPIAMEPVSYTHLTLPTSPHV